MKRSATQRELTVVSWEEQGQEARHPAQEQGQHGDGAASHANQWDQKAGRLWEAREELSREHVHAEGADVHADAEIRQSRSCTGEEKEEEVRKWEQIKSLNQEGR